MDEFNKLYTSLFKNAHLHIAIVRILATSRQGLTRNKILQLGQFTDGGSIQKALEELEFSGFIDTYHPFGKKKKEKLFRLTDEYSLFYLQFMEGKKQARKDNWQHLSQTQSYKIWSGYAFENVCLKHIPQIKKALEIGGIYTASSSFFHKGTKEQAGLQIDLLLDRNDQVINLFDIKFYNAPFLMTKQYTNSLRERMALFRQLTQTRKQLSWVFISVHGIKQNLYSQGIISNDLNLDDLFIA